MKTIDAPRPIAGATSQHVVSGLPIPKTERVRLFSPQEWEEFTEEYAHGLPDYFQARRFGGAGDKGVDIACFHTDQGFKGGWDNYQCKRYGEALTAGDVWLEIGKTIYYTFMGDYTCPNKYYFCAPKGIGISLNLLLGDVDKLKAGMRAAWDKHCTTKITSTVDIPLTGDLLTYFDRFDFSIFGAKTVLELIEGHSRTTNHIVRFGGGLPFRTGHEEPPAAPRPEESRYIRQLLDAYADHTKEVYTDLAALSGNTAMNSNLQRQRERFYHAESLKNFARDSVPVGTFTKLQDEIYHAIVDTCESKHASGFECMTVVVNLAGAVLASSNPLAPATTVQDRMGICHQLANEDRVKWVK